VNDYSKGIYKSRIPVLRITDAVGLNLNLGNEDKDIDFFLESEMNEEVTEFKKISKPVFQENISQLLLRH